MRGKILFKSAQNFLVEDNETKKQYSMHIRKKTKVLNTILVGDDVEYIQENNEYVIENILDRKNCLFRPKVANIDYVFIVYSVKEPDFNSFLLNKFLALYESRNIKNVIIYFSKMDLLNKEELNQFNKIIETYKNNGYIVFESIKKEVDKNSILHLFQNNVVCFAGQSGVGKSTFINFLIPQLNIRTQEISNALNRGKHTTTTSTIIPINDGYVIDTPGFSSIELDMSNLELSKSFHDFRENCVECKFSNCLHDNEKGCKIKELVSNHKIDEQRYNDYLKMLKDSKKKSF